VSPDEAIASDFVGKLASLSPGITPSEKLPACLSQDIWASELGSKIRSFIGLLQETVMKISGAEFLDCSVFRSTGYRRLKARRGKSALRRFAYSDMR
jgi:hypothetical protein